MKVYKYQKYGKKYFYLVDDEDFELLIQKDNYWLGTKALTHEEKEFILKDAKLINNTKYKIYSIICFAIGLGLNIEFGQKGLWYAILTFFAFYVFSFMAIAVIYAILKTCVFDKSLNDEGANLEAFIISLFLSYVLPIFSGVLTMIIILSGGQIP